MDKFQVKKVENCFKNSQTYEYKIQDELNEEFIKRFEDIGKVEIKKFRRPIFMINCQDETKIKGVINSKILKVSFPDDIWQVKKEEFEIYLNTIL